MLPARGLLHPAHGGAARRGACSGDLEASVDESQPTVSHHLSTFAR
jgi:hypothetical protein